MNHLGEVPAQVEKHAALYRFLLRAYPAGFRQEYEALMVQLFRDNCCDVMRQNAPDGLLKLWANTCFDLFKSTIKERLRPPPGGNPINFPKGKFWLARTPDNHIVAPYKVCPHLGCLYNWNEAGNRFLCPCHYSQYQLDGTVMRGPATRSTDRFVIRLLNDQGVEVAATDQEGNPLLLPSEDLQIIVETGQLISGKTKGMAYPVGEDS